MVDRAASGDRGDVKTRSHCLFRSIAALIRLMKASRLGAVERELNHSTRNRSRRVTLPTNRGNPRHAANVQLNRNRANSPRKRGPLGGIGGEVKWVRPGDHPADPSGGCTANAL